MTSTLAPTRTRIAAAGVVAALAAALTLTTAGAAQAAPPVGANDFYDVVVDTSLTVSAPGLLANDSDPDGDPITVHSLAAPAGGAIGSEALQVDAAGGFIYTPPTGYTGTRTWQYRVHDGVEVTGLLDITFTISAPLPPANAAPVAVADAYSVVLDTPFAVGTPGLLANDSDPDGDALQFVGIVPPAGGMIAGESIAMPLDGSFSYTPPTGFTGTRVFSYEVTDGTATSSATFTFTIETASGNQAPTPTDDYYTVESGKQLVVVAPGLLSNDTDPDGDVLSFSTFYAPVGGLLAGEQLALPNGAKDGSFLYTPPTGFTGLRTFDYAVTDGDLYPKGQVTFEVLPAGTNATPLPADDAYATPYQTAITVDAATGVLANDVDGNGDALEVFYFGPASSGTFQGQPDGSFTFTPSAGFSGDVTLSYGVSDGSVTSADASITITVGDAPVPPADPEPPLDPPASRPENDLGTLGDDESETTALANTGAEGAATLAGLAALLLMIGAVARTISRRFA
jgi:hypothetical protein